MTQVMIQVMVGDDKLLVQNLRSAKCILAYISSKKVVPSFNPGIFISKKLEYFLISASVKNPLSFLSMVIKKTRFHIGSSSFNFLNLSSPNRYSSNEIVSDSFLSAITKCKLTYISSKKVAPSFIHGIFISKNFENFLNSASVKNPLSFLSMVIKKVR